MTVEMFFSEYEAACDVCGDLAIWRGTSTAGTLPMCDCPHPEIVPIVAAAA